MSNMKTTLPEPTEEGEVVENSNNSPRSKFLNIDSPRTRKKRGVMNVLKLSHKNKEELTEDINYFKNIITKKISDNASDEDFSNDESSLCESDKDGVVTPIKQKNTVFGIKSGSGVENLAEELSFLRKKFTKSPKPNQMNLGLSKEEQNELKKLREIKAIKKIIKKKSRTKKSLFKFRRTIKNKKDMYDLSELLGRGAFGRVYKGINTQTKKEYAIKIIKTSSRKGDDYKTIKRELEILSKCDSKYIVRYHDAFFSDSKLFIVMELCEGGSLSELMSVRKRPFTEKEISVICRKVLECMAYIHSRHIVHRDIKAGNILINKKGEIKLVDFGISTVLRNTLSRRKTFAGSPYWMAPEVILSSGTTNTYDKRVDIWSFGITIIELAEKRAPLMGIHPFRAIFLIPNQPSPVLDETITHFSDDIKDFIGKCLQKNPSKRWTVRKLLNHRFIKQHKKENIKFLKNIVDEVTQIYEDFGGKEAYNKQKNSEQLKIFDDDKDDDDDDYSTSDSDNEEYSETFFLNDKHDNSVNSVPEKMKDKNINRGSRSLFKTVNEDDDAIPFTTDDVDNHKKITRGRSSSLFKEKKLISPRSLRTEDTKKEGAQRIIQRIKKIEKNKPRSTSVKDKIKDYEEASISQKNRSTSLSKVDRLKNKFEKKSSKKKMI